MAERWPRLVAGDVAIDFANTALVADDDLIADILSSTGEFLAWSRHAGVPVGSVHQPAPPDDEVLDAARAIRAAVHRALEQGVRGVEPDASVLEVVTAGYADAIRQAAPVWADGRLTWSWDGSARGALSALTVAAGERLRAGFERVKACPACGFLFVDSTRSGTRRWCAMEDCGTDQKKRRYVAHRAEVRRAAREHDGAGARG